METDVCAAGSNAYRMPHKGELQMSDVSRRDFMKRSATTSAGAAVGVGAITMAQRAAAKTQANEKIRVAVLGLKGRGGSHIEGLGKLDNVEIAAVCDPDQRFFKGRIKQIEQRGWGNPKAVVDLREIMDDKDIDVVTVATPNHWHSLASIWAMQAGKDVYCEKPCSHNIFEGRQLSNATKAYDRICQHGSQIRSNPAIIEAIQHIRDGLIGEVYMARGLCYRWRDSIGKTPPSNVPNGVDYDIWQGPAPEGEFSENRFHYNWHYLWDFGNGDIGNQGVHQMDICRWGLDVKYPKYITSGAGMYLFDDDKEVPNVINSTFSFPDAGPQGKMMVFDVRPWMTNDEKGAKVGVIFYGSEGYIVIDSYTHYQSYLGKNEERGPGKTEGGDHYANFIDAVRAHDASILNAPIEEGHYSSALCHLGLTAARLNRNLEFDAEKEQYVGDDEANQYISRDYRAPYVVPAIDA
jgi:predicted dehydrogenase